MKYESESLTMDSIIEPDSLAEEIVGLWGRWDSAREEKKKEWQELREYLYATDTTKTTNRNLPWRNTTITPKLTQIHDNLLANYKSALFPKDKWLVWEADNQLDQDKGKVIEPFIHYMVTQPIAMEQLERIIQDFIVYGNAFAMPRWVDQSYNHAIYGTKTISYTGPIPYRISPLDIVFDPTASSFYNTPKIIRSVTTITELEKLLESDTFVNEEQRDEARQVLNYLVNLRALAHTDAEDSARITVDGFGSFKDYLTSGSVEVLTFYGDIYSFQEQKLLRNKIITVVDRHKVFAIRDNPSYFSYPPIFHVSWRKRTDNLWGMGPLDNLVGMQYRLDHLENLMADLMDLTVFPPLFVRGQIEHFQWGPFEKIMTSDPQAVVQLLTTDTKILEVQSKIERILLLMEEMAGAPREAMGFRTPGEKTAFEIQQLSSAASRIFQEKITLFERKLVEPLVNAMLVMARYEYDSVINFTYKGESGEVNWESITVDDITGVGRIRPKAARHFVDRQNLIQNLQGLVASGLMADPGIRRHISGKRAAKLIEQAMELDDYRLFSPNIAIAEDLEAEKQKNVALEELQSFTETPAGLTPEDTDNIMPMEMLMQEEMPEDLEAMMRQMQGEQQQ